MTDYVYSISDDFPDGQVNPVKLSIEIKNSSLISKNLLGINTDEDSINIMFEEDLSPIEKITLDGGILSPCGGIISSHDYVPYNISPDYYYTYKNSYDDYLVARTTSWINKMSMNIPNAVEGLYKISWSYDWGMAYHKSNRFKTRIILDDDEDNPLVEDYTGQSKFGATDSDFQSESGFRNINLSSGLHTLKFDFGISDSKYTCRVRNLLIDVLKVG